MIETSNSNHPAANFETDLLKSHRRGALAIGALGLTALVHVADIGISAWQNSLISQAQQTPGSVAVSVLELSDALTVRVSLGILGLLLVTGVLFLRWLRQVVRTGKSLGAVIKWTPKEVFQGFVVPGLNIKRPYEIVKAVHDALKPDSVPAPTAVLVAAVDGGYRDTKVVAPPEAGHLPNAAIGAWWASFWVGGIVANVSSRNTGTTLADITTRNLGNIVSSSIHIVAAILAIVMVRGLNARLQEWYRRVRHNSVETLATAGIVIGPSDTAGST